MPWLFLNDHGPRRGGVWWSALSSNRIILSLTVIYEVGEIQIAPDYNRIIQHSGGRAVLASHSRRPDDLRRRNGTDRATVAYSAILGELVRQDLCAR